MTNKIRSGFGLNLKDKTAFTTEAYYADNKIDLWIGTTGGTVYVEVKCGDGVWRTYPELTLTQATAQIVTIKRGFVRFRTDSTVAITVEISA